VDFVCNCFGFLFWVGFKRGKLAPLKKQGKGKHRETNLAGNNPSTARGGKKTDREKEKAPGRFQKGQKFPGVR